jgi:hypothetical protein
VLPAVPRWIVRRPAAPYIAGDTLDDADAVVRRLNGEGKLATIDVLGKEVASPEEEAGTGLGLELGEELCRANLESLVLDARAR